MTKKEAYSIVEDFYSTNVHTDEEEFMFTEAARFIIEKYKDTDMMMSLGGWYYEKKQFDLALKYYELAATCGDKSADECLGYIWYYGRTGERNYEKAFRHFKAAMDRGNDVAAYKVADMYKNGYFVDKDYNKYKEIIEDLYEDYKDFWDEPWNSHFPIAEIFTRLAGIRKDEGKNDEAIELYEQAKESLGYRIADNPFFGNLNIMKWLIDDLYELKEFSFDEADFYDLYYLLKTPGKIRIKIDDIEYEINVEQAEGECAVEFLGKWYRRRDEFIGEAQYDQLLLTDICYEIEILGKD